MKYNFNDLDKLFINKEIDPKIIDHFYELIEPWMLTLPHLGSSRSQLEKFLTHLSSELSKLYNVPPTSVYAYDDHVGPGGGYNSSYKNIFVNTYTEQNLFLHSLHVFLHEFRHHLQEEALYGDYGHHDFSDKQMELFKLNDVQRDFEYFNNYIYGIGGDLSKYSNNQPFEKDAEEYAHSFMMQLLNKFQDKHYQSDIINKFKKDFIYETQLFYQTEAESKQYLEDVFKIWEFKQKKNDEVKERFEYCKDLPNCNMENLENLFEHFTWKSMSTFRKLSVLKEYELRIAKKENREPFDVELATYSVDGVPDININRPSYWVLNKYYGYAFEKWCLNTIKAKPKQQKELVKQLKQYVKLNRGFDPNLEDNKVEMLRRKYISDNLSHFKSIILDNIDDELLPDPHYEMELNDTKKSIESIIDTHEKSINTYHKRKQEQNNNNKKKSKSR